MFTPLRVNATLLLLLLLLLLPQFCSRRNLFSVYRRCGRPLITVRTVARRLALHIQCIQRVSWAMRRHNFTATTGVAAASGAEREEHAAHFPPEHGLPAERGARVAVPACAA